MVADASPASRAAERLARRAAAAGRTLDALIEVDLTGERTGVPPERGRRRSADRVAALEGLRLVGLMTCRRIPSDPEDARPFFRGSASSATASARRHPEVLELSMGMSLDYEVAVEEGATMVRIGTALFGPRAPST